MKHCKIVFLTNIFIVLFILSGCSKAVYNKTVDAYVLVKETDDIALDNDKITSFMSEYYKNSDNIKFTSSVSEYPESGRAMTHIVQDINRDLSVANNDDAGLCFEYTTVEKAKEDYSEFYLPNAATVSGLQAFCVRVGRYVFLCGAGLWKPLLDEIGIPMEKQTFFVADTEDVTYQKTENLDLNQLVEQLKEKHYTVLPQDDDDGYYIIISQNGDETYTVFYSDYSYHEFKKNKRDLKSFWFNDTSGVMSCNGLSVYETDSYIVISRGNSWLNVLNELR